MKKTLFILILALVAQMAFAQDDNKKKEIDPLDVSRELQKIADNGVPTVESVAQKKLTADTYYEEGMWKEAIEAYKIFAKDANWLANILSQCLEPFYSASYDDRKNVSYATLSKWSPYERSANEYKGQRDQAYIRIGLCYKQLGEIDNALAYLYKGLDLVNMKATKDWDEAATALAEIVGYTPPTKK